MNLGAVVDSLPLYWRCTLTTLCNCWSVRWHSVWRRRCRWRFKRAERRWLAYLVVRR